MWRRVSLSDDLVLEPDGDVVSYAEAVCSIFMSASSKEYIRGSSFNFTSLAL